MRTRKTLLERVDKRTQDGRKFVGPIKHIRAELDLLARRVRRLCTKGPDYEFSPEYSEVNISEILDLIKQAKQ